MKHALLTLVALGLAVTQVSAQNPFALPILPAGDAPQWIAIGDLDSDGRNDLVATNSFEGTLSVYLAIANGRFETALTLDAPGQFVLPLVDVDLADIDLDGDLDVITANETPATSDLAIYPNNGDGTFAAPVVRAIGSSALAHAIGDLDGDSWPDVVVTAGGILRYFRSTGGGGFASPVTLTVGGGGVGGDVHLGDVEGDGDLDIIAAAGSSLVVRANNGSGAFAAPLTVAINALSKRMVLGDWNGDARPDVGLIDNFGYLKVLHNNGAGAYSAPTIIYAGASGGKGIAIGDLDRDGNPDLAMTNYDGAVQVCRGLGAGVFAIATPYAVNAKSGLAFADVDGDDLPDAVVARDVADQLVIVPGDGQGGLDTGPSPIAFSTPPAMFGMGDLDGDALPDLVTIHPTASSLVVRLALATGGFAAEQSFALAVTPKQLVVARVNADTHADALVLDVNDDLSVLFANGAGGFGAQVASLALATGSYIRAHDITGDGFAELVQGYSYSISGYYYSDTAIWRGDGLGGFTYMSNVGVGASVAFGDFNEDGIDDLAAAAYSAIVLTRSNGAGGFSWSTWYPAGTLGEMRAVDLDGDTHLDIVASRHPEGAVVIHGDGQGALGAPTTYAAGYYAQNLAVADFDGDGDLDAAVTYDNALRYLDGTSAGTFVVGDWISTGIAHSSGIEAIDENRDGLVDILLGSDNPDGISVMHSHGSGVVPTIYCTAKTTSNGCVPSMGWTGLPSASAPSGFVVTCANVINQKNGLFFYSLSGRQSSPFQGGTLCTRIPIARTPLGNSGGNPLSNDCSGVFSIDMNAFARGTLGGAPQPALSVVGSVVTGQWWGRDPAASPATMLSNALDYLVGP